MSNSFKEGITGFSCETLDSYKCSDVTTSESDAAWKKFSIASLWISIYWLMSSSSAYKEGFSPKVTLLFKDASSLSGVREKELMFYSNDTIVCLFGKWSVSSCCLTVAKGFTSWEGFSSLEARMKSICCSTNSLFKSNMWASSWIYFSYSMTGSAFSWIYGESKELLRFSIASYLAPGD